MTTWQNFKKNISSISEEEMSVIDALSALQAERLRRGITQKDFAKKINMSQPQLAKIERLESTPSLIILNRYANGLQLEIKMQIVGPYHA